MAKELNKFVIGAIAIVILTAIVLVGIAVTSNYSRVLRKETTITDTNTSITDALETANVTNILANFPFLQEVTGCYNSSNSSKYLPDANFTIGEGDKNGGELTLTQGAIDWTGTGLNCTGLVYLAATDAQAAADKFSDGLAIFGTFSVIIILAIIGKTIIGLFRRKD